MGIVETISSYIPEVNPPKQKKLSFKEKIKWTLIVLVLFLIMGLVPLYGLGENALEQFEFLSVILGASFGSIISLGIGPIVTASIVLQLLNGSGILHYDMTSEQGKREFQSMQQILTISFIALEAFIYVAMGGLAPMPGVSMWILVFQLFLGGMIIVYLDQVVSKWGIGSGVSLFIAAGVSQTIFVRALNPLPSPNNPSVSSGAIPALFQFLSQGDPQSAALMLAGIIATIAVFAFVVYTQAMKVEVPLSFGRVRGHGVRWPLSFFYTNVMPVILVAALLANIQLFGKLLDNWGFPILGQFAGNTPISGLAAFMYSPNIVQNIITGSLSFSMLFQALVYVLIYMVGCMVFSIFWMQSGGMDAKSQAKQMMASGLQIPGFRRDQRVLERLLNRYIWPLTVMGGLAVGFLAAIADLTGAFGGGTGILLTVMIIYKLYEEIAKQHMMDMNPMMRKFMTT
ncbi:preprotein translocase subunit SecY [Nanoarchaeota archaeon]